MQRRIKRGLEDRYLTDTGLQTDRETDRQTYKLIEKHTDKLTYKLIEKQADKLTYKLTEEQTDRQTPRRTQLPGRATLVWPELGN